MALLGFGAVGRHALGQLPALGFTNTVLIATAAGYAAAGQGSVFRSMMPLNSGASASFGSAAALGTSLSAMSAGFNMSLNASAFRRVLSVSSSACSANGLQTVTLVRMPSLTGAHLLAGKTAATATSVRLGGGTYVVSGYPSGVIRDFEAWFPRTFDASGWTGVGPAADTWTAQNRSAIAWTGKAVPTDPWMSATRQPESWTIE